MGTEGKSNGKKRAKYASGTLGSNNGKRAEYGLKVLGNGELTKPLTVKASKVTKSAREKIEKAGGKIEQI